ncbi:MAG: anti-sigma factor antagonist [Treponema sp.]|nr:anti-sigma factor antagonist [Candidatus Treponema equifaecale]
MFIKNDSLNYNSNKDDILKAVNPAVNSAKGTLLMLNEAGVPEAKELYERFHLSQEYTAEKTDLQKILTKGLSTIQLLRYSAINYFAKGSGVTNIVDLGCGFSPRGLFFKNYPNFNYIGIDLPALINDLRIAGNDMNYVAGDMTNLSSLEKALKDVQGKILVITEGVLTYFTENELKIVIQNIHVLLEKYGGAWITPDFYNNDFMAAVMEPLLGKDAYAKVKSLLHSSDKSAVGTEIRESQPAAITYGLTMAGRSHLIVRDVDFIPEYIKKDCLKELQPEQKNAILENYKNFHMSFLFSDRSDDARSVLYADKGKSGFDMTISQHETALIVYLSGRLDTISSPDLLTFYDNSIKSRKIEKKIIIDCEKLEYVSSAGLRVFLMMYKDRNKNLELINCNETVDEILEQTGFKEFLCK